MDDETPEVLQLYYPGGFYGYDRDGRPVFIEPLGTIDFAGILHSVKTEEVVNYKRKQCEFAKKICQEQEEKLGKSLKKYSTLILDGDGASRKHLWKPGLDMYKATVQMYEQEYPDLRQRIIIINTPVIFPIVFALLKPLLRQETKDKIKILGSNWKKDILEFIDEDNLPEHYGGKAKDEDGSPKCDKHICYGGDVARSYYVTENVDKENFESATVKAGQTVTIKKEITVPKTKVRYQFATTDFDIGFWVDLEVSDGDNENILPQKKTSSHIIIEEGEITCERTGNYLFTFDNSYSWIRDKQLFYMIEVASE